VRAGALTLALSGGVSAVMQLLVPLQLHAAGRSSQDIGLTLSAGAVVYIVISALSVQLGPRITNRRANAAMAALMALALLPALVGSATAWVITALLLTVVPRAVTGTVAYALATGDREEGGPGTGAILGLLNALWAVATVAAPVAAGALKTAFDARTAYAAILLAVAAVAVWLLRDARSEPAAAPGARFGLRRPADRTGSAAGRDWPAVDVHPPADRTPTGQIPVVR
jgi:MFS family permease